MSQSVWGYWLIALGIGVITVMMLVQNYTTINQEDYYLLKEVTQAAMTDAIDYNHYRQYGELKINREKFIENFERRFAESVKGNKNYKTDFYSIYETPPKVSVRVSTSTSSFNVSGNVMDLDVTNSIDAILENNSTNTVTKIFYSVPYGSCSEDKKDALGYCTVTNSPTLNNAGIKTNIVNELAEKGISVSENELKIVSAKYIGPMTTDAEFAAYESQYYETYGVAYNSVDNRAPIPGECSAISGMSYSDLIANDLVDVKLTVSNNKVLAWSGKFKCYGSQGYPEGSYEVKSYESGCGTGNSIAGQCLIGIKYELKFSY